jgi:3-oxoacyl-(acyl-carrier-protein) synthase
MSGRPVYLAAGEMVSCHGRGIAAAVTACLNQDARPGTVTVPYLGDELSLPYYRMDSGERGVRELLLSVAVAALDQAGVNAAQRQRTAVIIGSSSLDMNLHEQEYQDAHARDPGAIVLRNPDQGYLAESLALELGLHGPRFTLLTACSAGANALLHGAWMIRQGLADDVLVLGTEVFNLVSLLGFHGMLLLSKTRACRPFDQHRDGIVLGEAVAAAVLSARPVTARWRLSGGATLCDTSQPTNSLPEKMAEVIRSALADSSTRAGDIACVKAHGTGTGANDLSEAGGLREVFGGHLPPTTSIKPVLGHTLGACGVAETLTLLACLEGGVIPAVANFSEPDPELGLNPLTEQAHYPGGPVLLNYFGFGGNNCALVFSPVPPEIIGA